MKRFHGFDRKRLGSFLASLSITSIMILSMLPVASAAPTGSYFNHVVIIAMENQNYGSVIGSSSAPFINSLAALGTTISNYHSYAQGISGCSAGCYQAFTAGQVVGSDSWCPRASSPCKNVSNIAGQLSAAGLTSAMFCEDGCPRGADHFPWIGYTDTWNSCVTGTFSCNGQTGPTGNLLYGSMSSNSGSFSSVNSNAGNTAFINYLNSANPANYIWFTPSDNHNMHDNSVSTGDNYIASLLVGTGTVSNPSPGTVFSTNLLKQPGTFLYLWWDEYDPSPNVEYGTMIKVGHTSTGGYDEYDSLHSIEANWGLPYITSVVSGDTGMTDIFGTGGGGSSFSTSFTYTPASPQSGSSVTFTALATGGTAPYTYSWDLGDGSTTTGPSTGHLYTSPGAYTVTLTTTDSTGKTSTQAQNVNVVGGSNRPSQPPNSQPSNGGTCALCDIPHLLTTLSVLSATIIGAGIVGVSTLLARYHAHNRRLSSMLDNEESS